MICIKTGFTMLTSAKACTTNVCCLTAAIPLYGEVLLD